MTSGHENGIENANELLLYTYLINNPRMFNGAIVDLAEKPYIPQKILFANVLRDVIGIVIFDLRGHGGC